MYKVKPTEISCRYCGKTSIQTQNSFYCSITCRNRYYWEKRHGNVGIACKICGKKYRKVVSHVYQSHGMNKREYKEEFGLDVKRGIVLPETRDYLGKLVKENGTVNNLKAGRKYWFKKGISNNYQRSEQTMERLRKHWAIVRTLKKEGK